MTLPRRVLALLLLFVGSLNLAYVLYRTFGPRRRFVPSSRHHTYEGHDHPLYLPLPGGGDLAPVILTDEESELYPVRGLDSDAQWASLSPVGSGYFRLGPNSRIFTITMSHELHCLRILNLAFGKAEIANAHHIQHCLNYLRLGAMCRSDLALEPGDFEQKDYELERVGATHMCRDWTTVYAVVEDNYAAWKNRSAEG